MDNIDREKFLLFLEEEMRRLDQKIFTIDPRLNKTFVSVKDAMIYKRQVFESIYGYFSELENSLDFEKLNDKLDSDAKKILNSLS